MGSGCAHRSAAVEKLHVLKLAHDQALLWCTCGERARETNGRHGSNERIPSAAHRRERRGTSHRRGSDGEPAAGRTSAAQQTRIGPRVAASIITRESDIARGMVFESRTLRRRQGGGEVRRRGARRDN